MTLKQIIPWRWGGLRSWEGEDRPFESMGWIHKEMDLLFEDFWKGSGRPSLMTRPRDYAHLNPRLDETEDEKAFHVKIELPGMDQEDVDITLSDGLLTIRGDGSRRTRRKARTSTGVSVLSEHSAVRCLTIRGEKQEEEEKGKDSRIQNCFVQEGRFEHRTSENR